MKNIIEINKENYRRFETMTELVNAMRKSQKVWSWGARGWTNIEHKFLKFRVSGHLFRGVIYVGVNGGDLFDIYLTNLKGVIQEEMKDVYIDELVDRIDQKVERITAYKW
jgi:hypothetical protein